MKNWKLITIALAIIVIALVARIAFISKQHHKSTFDEMAKSFEKSAEKILDDEIDKVSKTELAATMVFQSETDEENSVYYRILKTTYYESGDPSLVTGLHTEALNLLFPVDGMDTCEEMMINDWYGALYKKDDKAYLCWTYSPEVTYILEYTPSKMPDSEILKMAESARVTE